jgi:hypothetical protein
VSYSTNLYAVDFDRLRAAVGSKDEKLLKKVVRKCFGEIDDRPRGKRIRVEVSADGSILLDGQLAGLPELNAAIEGLTGMGDKVCYRPTSPEAGSPIFSAIVDLLNARITAGHPVPGIEGYAPGQEWVDQSPGEDSRDKREHIRRLVFGEHEGADPSDLAYALESLCRVLGKSLDTEDALGSLEDLELGSPLIRWRLPVEIPRPRDFPFISYLTPEEVDAEVARLKKRDLPSGDEDIEHARRMLLKYLRAASRKKSAVVAFYY